MKVRIFLGVLKNKFGFAKFILYLWAIKTREMGNRAFLSIEEVEELCKELDWNVPFMKNYRWQDEQGNKYSFWDIYTPGMTIHTGDGGAALIFEALKKEGEKFLKKNLENPK